MRASLVAALLALVAVLTACTAPEEPDLPSLAEVAAARSAEAPPPAGAPGPPVTDACPLLSTDEVSQALGRPTRAAGRQEIDSLPEVPQGRGFLCHYGSEASVSLLVGIVPASVYTPQQIVDRNVGFYEGVLDRPTDLGDAAILHRYADVDAGFVVAAKSSGPEVRWVSVTVGGNGDPGPALLQLARLALDRI